MMLRSFVLFLAFVSFFIFPWQVSAAALLIVSLMMPPACIVLGVLGDALYYSPDSAFLPYFTLFGIGSLIFGLLVQRFVKTRIME